MNTHNYKYQKSEMFTANTDSFELQECRNLKRNNTRGMNSLKKGVVINCSGSKTVRVKYLWKQRHCKYGKIIKRARTYQVHDEENCCHIGDLVEFVGCRPVSKTKSHRIVRVFPRNDNMLFSQKAIIT